MTKYVKYIRDDVAYYIREDLVDTHIAEGDFAGSRPNTLMQLSDFVVDTASNTIVKCRYPIEDLVEAGHAVRPVKQRGDVVAQSVENLRNELIARSATGHLTVGEQTILFKLNSCLYKEYPHKEHK